MAKSRRQAVEERFSDNPFLPPTRAGQALQFPEGWTKAQKDAYMQRQREASRRIDKKEREGNAPFQGETITLRRGS